MELRDFEALWKFYPLWSVEDTVFNLFLESQQTPFETKSWVLEHVKNTCVIRVCYALNCSVNPIRRVRIGANYLTGVKGYYLIRVADLRHYLTKRYGAPNVETSLKGDKAKEILKGKKGLVCFDVPYGDATGHFDLWNGSTIRKSDQFNHAKLQKVSLWEVSG